MLRKEERHEKELVDVWEVTLCKGDYRLPVRFTNQYDINDFLEILFKASIEEDMYTIVRFYREEVE